MQFLVEFEVEVPARTLDQQVEQHQRAESAAAAELAEDGRSSSLTRVLRLEATLGEPLDLGDIARGCRRIMPLTERVFAGPELTGTLLPGSSGDWQIVLPDGTTLGDIRYTLQTDDGDPLYVQSRGVRHGSADALARLARGEDVDASEYIPRTSTQIETATPALDWFSKGVLISVGGRQPGPSSMRPTSSDEGGDLHRRLHCRRSAPSGRWSPRATATP
jgi:hypothetical protein